MRIDRRVSPNQTALWTVHELTTPRHPETPSAHPIRAVRVGLMAT